MALLTIKNLENVNVVRIVRVELPFHTYVQSPIKPQKHDLNKELAPLHVEHLHRLLHEFALLLYRHWSAFLMARANGRIAVHHRRRNCSQRRF